MGEKLKTIRTFVRTLTEENLIEFFSERKLSPLQWRLFLYMYDRYFRYGKYCSITSKSLARIFSRQQSAEAIRNALNVLKNKNYIQVSLMPSDFHRLKTVAYRFPTDEGQRLFNNYHAMQDKLKQMRQNSVPISNTEQKPVEEKVVKYSNFDRKTSKRFARDIRKSLATLHIHKVPRWNDKAADEIRKLRQIDGYSEKDIEETLNYIVNDCKENGFCMAKNIRSCSTLRVKWRNGITKFDTAFEAMKEAKLEHPDLDDPETLALNTCSSFERHVFTPPFPKVPDEESEQAQTTSKGKFRIEYLTNCLYYQLVDLPTPNWKQTDSRFLEFEQLCYDTAVLFNEFVIKRGWPTRLLTRFAHILEIKNKKLQFWTVQILRENVWKFAHEWVDEGFFMEGWLWQIDKHGKKVYEQDFGYKKRVDDFLVDQKAKKPFLHETVLLDAPENVTIVPKYEYEREDPDDDVFADGWKSKYAPSCMDHMKEWNSRHNLPEEYYEQS